MHPEPERSNQWHDVEHRANGGETSLDNLMLLCTKHHTLVHEGGFTIRKNFLDQWYFVRPDGIGVPDCGYVSGVYENATAVACFSAVEKRLPEPSEPLHLL